MTDVGRVQEGPIGAAQAPPRRQIQVVPLKGLPIVMQVATLIIMTRVATQ
ncbi:MAG TPA: hypothetical protein VLW50_33980 [Streptosporangiaceae bacterium]|nr:hypothetical protein [Streptosporangiaceae bacterium]